MELIHLLQKFPKLRFMGPCDRKTASQQLNNSALQGGVYLIMPPDWAWVYVGSTSSIRRRLAEHWSLLRNNKHDKAPVQQDYTEGTQLMTCYCLVDSREKAYEIEQTVMDLWTGNPGLLNIAPDARVPWSKAEGYVHPNLGRRHSAETKQKQSHITKEQYAAGRLPSMLGRKHSQETKKLIAQKAIGREVSDATKAKLSSQRQLGMHSRAKPVVINGVEYDCVKSAADALEIPYSTIYWRVLSVKPEFNRWNFKTS